MKILHYTGINFLAGGCFLLSVVTIDTKSTDISNNQPVSSSGVGELL